MVGRAKVLGISAYLPEREVSSKEVEDRIRAESRNFELPAGIIETASGVTTRRMVADDVDSSDLAAAAGRGALLKAGIGVEEIDLLIFSSASQDIIEPATANIVQEKTGTSSPVFDLKNACNSFLNGLEIAESLVLTGRYNRILVTTGETPTKAIRWSIDNKEQFRDSFLGYTLGDAGAAAVVTASDDERGIVYRAFQTVSRHWDIVTLPGGGSMHGYSPDYAYFRGDGKRLRSAFEAIGPGLLLQALKESGTCFDDYSRIFVHQATMQTLEAFCAISGVPKEKVSTVLPRYGNMASASLPVAFSLAEDEKPIQRGEMTMWLGLAAGLSLGAMFMRF